MTKIPLNQKIVNIKVKPMKSQELVNPKDKKSTEKKDLTIRDYLLTILGTKFAIQNVKETFWTTQLGIQFADDKIKEVEISDDKAKFLRRIIEANKTKVIQANPMGGQTEEEIELFFPYELGQLLAIFATEEEKNA